MMSKLLRRRLRHHGGTKLPVGGVYYRVIELRVPSKGMKQKVGNGLCGLKVS